MAGKLIDIFQNCKCVKEEKHLAAGEVRSLAFGDNNTVMVVELGLHEVVSRKVIARAEKQIADTYGLHALHRGQLVADHLLQGTLQVRIAVIAKLGRKAHDRAFTHADSHTQTARGHERGLVVVL